MTDKEGWQWVPKKPWPIQSHEGGAILAPHMASGWELFADQVYEAMIAAAPQSPPSLSAAGVTEKQQKGKEGSDDEIT